MLFNSFEFLLFFPIVTLLYFVLPYGWRWALLLAASCYFYMAFVPIYILILGFTIVIDYFAGIWIENAKQPHRKLFLTISLVANIGVLALFKYYNFLNENLTHLLGLLERPNPIPYLEILLPIGLSFHTFQAMSYTIEVYRGNQKAERHFGIYSLYVMFYPQLVAGPIERPQNILHQFYEKHDFNFADFSFGMKMALWGMFKKVVIADRLSLYVDAVYNHPTNHSGITILVATIFFSIQIYCDFSGYSDIAIGTARAMGFHLMTNFNRPYFARTISEFWKRWHISLSTWFRDYLYIPLGGNRVGHFRKYFNLFFVFLVSGLWHGANWTFIIWGALHGTYLVIGQLTQDFKTKIKLGLGIERSSKFNKTQEIFFTCVLAVFAWIFFRANSLETATVLIKRMVSAPGGLFLSAPAHFIYGILGIIVLFSVEVAQEYFPNRIKIFNNQRAWVRITAYSTVILAILLFGVFDGGQFIYFQF